MRCIIFSVVFFFGFANSVWAGPGEIPSELLSRAEAGDVNAQNKVGTNYARRKPPDYINALKWFSRAADQGYGLARYNLGVFFYEGWGLPKNFVLAYMWFVLAGDDLVGETKHKEKVKDIRLELLREIIPKLTNTERRRAENMVEKAENHTGPGLALVTTMAGYLRTFEKRQGDLRRAEVVINDVAGKKSADEQDYQRLSNILQNDGASGGDTNDINIEVVRATIPLVIRNPVIPFVNEEFQKTLEWNEKMYRASTAGLNFVEKTLNTGEFDQQEFDKIKNQMEESIRQHPWAPDDAKSNFSEFLDSLIAEGLSAFFLLLSDFVAPYLKEIYCERINCDCDNVPQKGLKPPNEMISECRELQETLKLQCQENMLSVESCSSDPNKRGPNAWPIR